MVEPVVAVRQFPREPAAVVPRAVHCQELDDCQELYRRAWERALRPRRLNPGFRPELTPRDGGLQVPWSRQFLHAVWTSDKRAITT